MKFFRSLWFGSVFHFWYIYMIIGIYLITPIINPWVCTTNDKGFLYFFSIWGVSVFFLQYKFEGYKPNFDLIYFSKYLGYFVLGYFLGKNDFSKFKKIILFVYNIMKGGNTDSKTRYLLQIAPHQNNLAKHLHEKHQTIVVHLG